MMANTPSNSAATDGARFPRIQSGNPQADEILGGGFPSNSINILMGAARHGKNHLRRASCCFTTSAMTIGRRSTSRRSPSR